MAGDDLFDYAKTVKSRGDFVIFLNYLSRDLKENSSEWQNGTLEEFLSGLAGFAGDMRGYYKNMGENIDVEAITWRMAAEMLLAASVYGS